MPDGVYVTGEDGRPSFVRAPQLTDDDVQQVVETTAKPVGHHATHISSQLWPFPARV